MEKKSIVFVQTIKEINFSNPNIIYLTIELAIYNSLKDEIQIFYIDPSNCLVDLSNVYFFCQQEGIIVTDVIGIEQIVPAARQVEIDVTEDVGYKISMLEQEIQDLKTAVRSKNTLIKANNNEIEHLRKKTKSRKSIKEKLRIKNV